mmetsp:Transcript_17749/g.45470  ORF Transcript_17749/g.45470 Transcript_17749/m.45470 type:complete len:333 (-) Transcript_17749:27-1025(-)|eukprot:jgi/Tetstr1/423558/TSEL_014231.t1
MDAAARVERRLGRLSAHLGAALAGGESARRSDGDVHSSSGGIGLRAAPCAAGAPANLLQDQVAIITGAGQGLGAAAAALFAQHGAAVVVSDLDGAKAAQVAEEIRQAGGQALSHAGDVTAEDFAGDVVKAAVQRFGRLDILVNNAGYTWDGMLHKMTGVQWEAMLAVHCTAPFRLIQAAAPYMRDAGKAEIEAHGQARPRCILNISSVSGTRGSVGQANYSTAKMGVVGLTKTVAKEWGPFNVRCNCIAFGWMDTRLTRAKEAGATMRVGGQEVRLGIPGAGGQLDKAVAGRVALRRTGSAAEGAAAMLMLVSPLASYVTGQTLEVNGGSDM